MTRNEPVAVLDRRFSAPEAAPTPWSTARERLEQAEVFWLSTVRPDGRPHVTPLIALWHNDALYFCTGPTERKAKNLAGNTRCVLTTGTNTLNTGLDVVVEGEATIIHDEPRLRALADAYEVKYGPEWHFDVRDGAFQGDGGEALVYRVAPSAVFAFAKGEYSQTRWDFPLP